MKLNFCSNNANTLWYTVAKKRSNPPRLYSAHLPALFPTYSYKEEGEEGEVKKDKAEVEEAQAV